MNALALRAIARADAPQRARPDALEHQLRRFRAEVQPRVRALAARHPRLADLAVSFPALLFALALPRGRFRPEPVIADVIRGVGLKPLAERAGVALWLRKLEPEMLRRPLPVLPTNEEFAKRIVNHFPRHPKFVADWLDAVAFAARWGHEDFAIWYARNFPTKRRPRTCLPLLCLWAWFSIQPGTRAQGFLEKPWNPHIEYKAAQAAAGDWQATLDLFANLGDKPIIDAWLAGDTVDGYEFVPILTAADMFEEARAMKNCLRNYGGDLVHDCSRFFSVRKDGARVATAQLSWWAGHPVLDIYEMQAAQNTDAPLEAWKAAGRWLRQHDPVFNIDREKKWGSVPLDRKTWFELWKPYWLAKRAIPDWLPLSPSREALNAL
jgi:hypothetical protein